MTDLPTKVRDMDADSWNVYCQKCSWKMRGITTRDEAVSVGEKHSERKHSSAWGFRIQGIKTRSKEVTPMPPDQGDEALALDLLDEWYQYWAQQDHMPSKMPNALHVRTGIALTMSGRDVRLPNNPPPRGHR